MRFLIALLSVLIVQPASAQQDQVPPSDIRIRAYLDPEGDIHVGQLTRLWVEVTTATQFTRAPRYPEFRLDGAIVLLPEQLGVNFSGTEGGETRVGQRQRYAIIPQRAGSLAIPSLTVTLGISVDGKPSEPVAVQTEPLDVTVVFPPGAEDLDQIVTLPELAVSEAYDRETEGLKVGDAVTRTVTLRGEGTFALALPQTKFENVEGARLYPAQPKLDDKVNRGQYRATRSDAATYVFEREGAFTLPEIAVGWFDPQSDAVKQTVLPEVSFTVAANPAFQGTEGPVAGTDDPVQTAKRWAEIALAWLRNNIVALTLVAMAAYIAALAFRRFAPPLIARWRAYRERFLQSEHHAFRLFRRACRSRDTDRMINGFWQWLDRLTPDDRVASLEAMTRRADDPDFERFAREFAENRYAGPGAGEAKSDIVYRQVARFRNNLLKPRRPVAASTDTLNPRDNRNAAGKLNAPQSR
jgi:hypothetical protein